MFHFLFDFNFLVLYAWLVPLLLREVIWHATASRILAQVAGDYVASALNLAGGRSI